MGGSTQLEDSPVVAASNGVAEPLTTILPVEGDAVEQAFADSLHDAQPPFEVSFADSSVVEVENVVALAGPHRHNLVDDPLHEPVWDSVAFDDTRTA
jgi:hypothetical protein